MMQCYDYSDYRQPVRHASFSYTPYARTHSYGPHGGAEYYNNTLHNRCTRCHEGSGGFQQRQAVHSDYMGGYKDQWYQYRFRRDLWPQNNMHMYQSMDWGGGGGNFNRSYWERQQAMHSPWSHYQMESSNMWSGYDRSSTGMTNVDPLRSMAAMHDSCHQEEEVLRHHYIPSPSHYSPDIPPPRPSPARPTTPQAPAVPPLPAFSQAFGSTEIGKYAEGINRSEDLTEEMVSDAIAAHSAGDMFQEWGGDSNV